MRFVTSVLVAVFLAQSPAPAVPGQISGRVSVDGTNAPIAGARVIIIPLMRPTRPPRTGPMVFPSPGTTDQDGRFVVANLAPGDYRLDVQKTGFASLQDPTTPSKTYTVGAGQSLNVSIVLRKGAVISGKLLDQKGEPVTDARMMALRKVTPPGRSNMPPRLLPAAMQGPQQTNDIGEFRVTGLTPGEYFVAAVPRFGGGFGGPGTTPATGTGGGALVPTMTYYPGTIDQAGAQAITVSSGAEVSNIVFSLQSAPAYRVSGVVVDENGAPIAHAMIMLMQDPRSGMMFMGPGGNAQTGDDGRFSIGDVTAGTYRINASVPMVVPPGGVAGVTGAVAGSNFTSWSISSNGITTTTAVNQTPQPPQEVVVADADVTGLRVVTRRPPGPPQ